MTSVIVLGAGPVGLGLACELGQRGIDCVVIEKRDGAINVPKQSVVSARNMEFCRRWGIADKVRKAVWPESFPRDFVYLASMRGTELMRAKVPSYEKRDPRDFTPEAACPCPQIYFDPILIEHAKTLPSVQLSYNTEMNGFVEDANGVTATVTNLATGEKREIKAKYLIGCDGPAGIVRRTLGIELEGLGTISTSINLFFRSPQLPDFHDKGWARFYRLIDETGCWSELIPIDGKELWRLTVFDEPLSTTDPDVLMRKCVGCDFPYEMISALPWERHDYVARSYGGGRVFIAGDAAHENSPTGGIGMHTGLEEIMNLGWKLAAVIEGWGGPQLLESYEAERRPIAHRNVSLATRTYNALTALPSYQEGSGADWHAENTAALSIPEHVKLHYGYNDSPICVDDGTPPLPADPPAFVPSTRPGTRAPHAWMADGRSTLDLFGDSFVLLRMGSDAPDAAPLLEAASRNGVPMREIAIAEAEIVAIYEKPLVLVRPDGHVAWRGDDLPADNDALIARVTGHDRAADGTAEMQHRRSA